MRGLAIALAALAISGAAQAGPYQTLDAAASYPEGPLIHRSGGALVAEMGADAVTLRAEDGRARTFFHQPGCGPTALAPYGEGFAVLCHRLGSIALIDAEGRALGAVERLGNPNDASADDAGGIFFTSPGTFSKDAAPEGRLFYLSVDGTTRPLAAGLWYPNGVYFDAAERALYVSEHLGRRILRYPVTAAGVLGPMDVFVEIDAIAPPLGAPAYREAGPDGLERAPNGDLVVALYGEGRLVQLTPTGALRRIIEAPAQFVTNIAFERDGAAIVTAPRINDAPPYPGAVARYPAETFAVDR